jgi:hypothetical protein
MDPEWLQSTFEDCASKLSGVNYKSLMFTAIVIPVLGLIYWIVNSQGLRLSISIFATKLYDIPLPGFSFLARYKGVDDLDLAHVFAIFMLFAVWFLTVRLLKMFLFGYEADARLNNTFHKGFLYSVSAVVILADLVMFYQGILDQTWGFGSAGGLTPAIATIGYTGLLAFLAYVHIILERRFA